MASNPVPETVTDYRSRLIEVGLWDATDQRDPSQSIEAAWQVVDHFERLGLVEIGKYYGWRVRFGDVEGDADTAPLAICRAALAAVSR